MAIVPLGTAAVGGDHAGGRGHAKVRRRGNGDPAGDRVARQFRRGHRQARGRGQAASLRAPARSGGAQGRRPIRGEGQRRCQRVSAPGDYVIVSAGERYPADGEIVRRGGTINESAVTGEIGARAARSGTDRSGVGGTKVLSATNHHPHHRRTRPQLPGSHDLRWWKAPTGRRRRTKSP